MRRGAWHQLGWNQQRLVLEQLQHGAGAGVVISPRDLKLHLAADYAAQYRECNASVLFDPQWHRPEFSNEWLQSYPTCDLRGSLPTLNNMTDDTLRRLKEGLVEENRQLNTDAVIAPAIMYAAGRPEIIKINSKLHSAARGAADELGIPCYATAFLQESVTASMEVLETVMSSVTSLTCDGWYFAFDFPDERIPSSRALVYRCLRACLLLALSGRPVLHAYAGPMGLLSIASGCAAAACGADQTQWRLCIERWEPPIESGGDFTAPPRYFSRSLWGTIVVPDELSLLPHAIQRRILHSSPFATVPLAYGWDRTAARKHNLYTMCAGTAEAAAPMNLRESRQITDGILNAAVQLYMEIMEDYHLNPKDGAAAYQANWRGALEDLWGNHPDDFDFIDFAG